MELAVVAVQGAAVRRRQDPNPERVELATNVRFQALQFIMRAGVRVFGKALLHLADWEGAAQEVPQANREQAAVAVVAHPVEMEL